METMLVLWAQGQACHTATMSWRIFSLFPLCSWAAFSLFSSRFLWFSNLGLQFVSFINLLIYKVQENTSGVPLYFCFVAGVSLPKLYSQEGSVLLHTPCLFVKIPWLFSLFFWNEQYSLFRTFPYILNFLSLF